MPKSPRKNESPDFEDRLFRAKPRKQPPHAFVLEALASLSPITRPMFGCLAIYVDAKIVLILRDKPTHAADNGVWLATAHNHHDSLRREFPSMRSVALLGKSVTGWQVLPADADDFEQSALRACELVLARDPRIGKIPKARRSRAASGRAASGRAASSPVAGSPGTKKSAQLESSRKLPERTPKRPSNTKR